MAMKMKSIFAEASAVTNGLAREDMKPELREMFFASWEEKSNPNSDTRTRFLDAL